MAGRELLHSIERDAPRGAIREQQVRSSLKVGHCFAQAKAYLRLCWVTGHLMEIQHAPCLWRKRDDVFAFGFVVQGRR